jgi:hypothetical protein
MKILTILFLSLFSLNAFAQSDSSVYYGGNNTDDYCYTKNSVKKSTSGYFVTTVNYRTQDSTREAKGIPPDTLTTVIQEIDCKNNRFRMFDIIVHDTHDKVFSRDHYEATEDSWRKILPKSTEETLAKLLCREK